MTVTVAKLMPSALAVALALAGFAATAPTASAATTTAHYQLRVSITCPTVCFARFPQLPANQALDIDHVACRIGSPGDVADVELILLPQSLAFSYPLGLVWGPQAGGSDYTFAAEMNVRVPLGKQVEVVVFGNDTSYGNCSITGTRIING